MDVTHSSNNLAWQEPGGTITGYQIQRRDSDITGTFAPIPGVGILIQTQAVDSNRVSGTDYFYRVRARNTAASPGPWSDELTTSTLPAPGKVTGLLVAVTHSSNNLAWQAPSGTITGYEIQRRDITGTFAPIPGVGILVQTQAVDSNGVAGTDYFYRVRARNTAASLGPWSDELTTSTLPAPEKVSGLSVAVTHSSNNLAWQEPGGTVTGYQVERRTVSDTFAPIPGVGILIQTQAVDSNRISGADYFYRARARNTAASPGPWSDEISTANNAPVAMAGDAQTVMAGATVTLTGDATDADIGDTITYSWNQFGTPAVSLIGGDEDAVRTFIAPDVSSETILTFVVTANDGVVNSNEGSMVNITVNPVSAPTDPPTADAPVTNFRATLMGDMVSLTWAVRADTTFSALELSKNDVIISQSLSATDTTDTGVAPGIYVYSLTYTTVPVGGADAETGTLTARITATAPSVSITTRQNAQVDSVITLSATVNDPDGRLDAVSYVWTSGVHTVPMDSTVTITATLLKAATANPTFNTTGLPSGTTLNFGLTATAGTTMLMDDISITIGSGASEAQVAAVVSGVARAIVASTISAVANRISTIASGGGVNVGGVNLNDSNMASVVQTNTQAFTTNSDAMKTLLGNSDFQLPLNAKGGGGGGGFDSVAVWASGEYSDVSGESKGIDWDGDLTGFHVGIDGKINTSSADNMLVGIAVSALKGDLDYTDETTADKGNYDISMTTISPYIGWRVGGIDLWASVGVGEGEIERTADDSNISNTSDAEQTAFAIGGSGVFHAQDSYNLRIKGELSVADLDIDDSDDGGNNPAIAAQNLKATHVKVAMEASQTNDLEHGGSFDKSVEIGARVDGGDGMTGAGVEIGGKLKYAHSIVGFTAEGSARFLLGRDGDYEEWGIQGTIRKQVGRDGQGLSFHLTPAYGDINSGVQQLLAQELNDAADNTADADYEMHMTTRLGYGIAYRGILTPYTEMVFGTTDQYRMGINWKPSRAFNLTLLSEQANQNTIRLQGTINL